MKSTTVFLTVSQAPSTWSGYMQLSPLYLCVHHCVKLHNISTLIITVSSVNAGHFKSLNTHSLILKSGSDSDQKCRRGEFFGLRVTDASDPSTRGKVVSHPTFT